MTDMEHDAPESRLYHVVNRPNIDGYGVKLHQEKANGRPFIGKVIDISPAHWRAFQKVTVFWSANE